MHTASPAERQAMGQAKRKQVGRQQQAEFSARERATSAQTLLKRADKGRLPALVTIKYQRMLASPFGYFRGAVPVMAADLAAQPVTGILVQLCGDAHVRNLGAYAAEDGRLIFDLNDFDETCSGPFEWDLKRMATSLVLAAEEAGSSGQAGVKAARGFVSSYARQMRAYAPMPYLALMRAEISRIAHAQPVHEALHKAVRATPEHTLEQLTEVVGDVRRFREAKPLLTRVTGSRAAEVIASLRAYRGTLQNQRVHLLDRYRPVDVAFKVVGTGSVGLRDYCVYLEGNGEGDPLFLQIKQAVASGYAPYLEAVHGAGHAADHAAHHQGQRVIEGQRLIQRGTDVFLGYTTIGGLDYLVRQLCDHKASIEIEDLSGDGLEEYAWVAGELLARGHARSGDAAVIAGYVGSGDRFAEAIAEFGERYAAQTVKDWKALKKQL